MTKWKTLREYWNSNGSDMEPETKVAVKVVASVGWSHDWAAYLGSSSDSDEEVAQHGDKISKDAAENLFPLFKRMELFYRE